MSRVRAAKLSRKTKYRWQRESIDRWGLLLLGEPDCYAYILRYSNAEYGNVWCWILAMPRGCVWDERKTGWDRKAFDAKLQVEAAIAEHWV